MVISPKMDFTFEPVCTNRSRQMLPVTSLFSNEKESEQWLSELISEILCEFCLKCVRAPVIKEHVDFTSLSSHLCIGESGSCLCSELGTIAPYLLVQ